jgi:hypothetical protein
MKMLLTILVVAALSLVGLVLLSCSTSGSAYYGVSVHSPGAWGHYHHRPHHYHHRHHRRRR